jgi:hypothetical protein
MQTAQILPNGPIAKAIIHEVPKNYHRELARMKKTVDRLRASTPRKPVASRPSAPAKTRSRTIRMATVRSGGYSIF